MVTVVVLVQAEGPPGPGQVSTADHCADQQQTTGETAPQGPT